MPHREQQAAVVVIARHYRDGQVAVGDTAHHLCGVFRLPTQLAVDIANQQCADRQCGGQADDHAGYQPVLEYAIAVAGQTVFILGYVDLYLAQGSNFFGGRFDQIVSLALQPTNGIELALLQRFDCRNEPFLEQLGFVDTEFLGDLIFLWRQVGCHVVIPCLIDFGIVFLDQIGR